MYPGERGFAKRFLRSAVGHPHPVVSVADLDFIQRALRRDEEIASSERDRFGNWELRFGPAAQTRQPPCGIDAIVRATRDRLRSQGEVLDPLWPEGRRFALCLTHDVDIVSSKGHGKRLLRRLRRLVVADGPRTQIVLNVLGSIYRLTAESTTPDELAGFERWLDIEAAHGFRSTWLFLPSHYAKPHAFDCDYGYGDRVIFGGRRMTVREMMSAILARGAEIGLHGSYASAYDSRILADEKRQVENATGSEVVSIRQHYLRYDAQSTPQVHESVGMLFDSTQGFNETIGLRAGTSFPYWCWNHAADRESAVLEIPMAVMDVSLLSIHPAKDAIGDAVELMREISEAGGCVTLNWHPNYLTNPRFMDAYEALLREAAGLGAWGCTMGELGRWWTARSQRLDARSTA